VSNLEFSVEILTSGHWPYQDVPKCKIPKQMTEVKDNFTSFYKNKFSNREIQWLFNHGTVQLQTSYLSKNYQIVVNCFQTSILCLFNGTDTLMVKDIQERLDLSDKDIKDSLLKLCNPRTRVLQKENAKKSTFEPNEQIRVNLKFENNNIRLNLVPVQSAAAMASDGIGGNKSMGDLDAEV